MAEEGSQVLLGFHARGRQLPHSTYIGSGIQDVFPPVLGSRYQDVLGSGYQDVLGSRCSGVKISICSGVKDINM